MTENPSCKDQFMLDLLHMLSNHPNILVKPIQDNRIDIHYGSDSMFRIRVTELKESDD